MKYFIIALILYSIALMTGCTRTYLSVDQSYNYREVDSFSYEIIDKASVTPQGLSIFKLRLENKLIQLELIPKCEPNRIIEIIVTMYYMRHGVSIALLGRMAGIDNITSEVVIKNAVSDEFLGRFTVVSKNPTSTGSARGLLAQHADKIVNYIKSGK